MILKDGVNPGKACVPASHAGNPGSIPGGITTDINGLECFSNPFLFSGST